ncbi:MAG: hypothetical protein HQ515_06910 [Phycisphaeraceae bacterium]|nr:hypothetical protein [Phycisphaeraceae bacterium]
MHSVLAVAINTVKQALRMKVALVFIVLLLVILPVMAFSASGDGTVKGRLQTFVSYGLSLTSFLLSLLTIFTAVHTTTGDIKQRLVYTVLTKPIRRYQYLLGKCLGILFLDLALLVVFGVGIYGVAVYGPDLMGADAMARAELNDQFYTARASLFPKTLDVAPDELEAEYQKLKKNQTMDQYFAEGTSVARIKDWLYKRMRLEKNAVAPGSEKIWEFRNVKVADPNGMVFVRFKFEVATTPEDDQLYSFWTVGDIRPYREGKQSDTPIYPIERKDPIRMYREFAIPADAIAADGYVAIAFVNPPINNTVVMFMEQGSDQNLESQSLALLFKAGTFHENFLRGICVVFFRLVFLAALASMASTFLSFPVAVLLSMVVFFTVSISGFVLESFSYVEATAGQIYKHTLALVIKGLPQFDKYNPSAYLIDGKLIDAEMFVWASWTIVWAALLMGMALLIFSTKELARDTS